MQMFPLETAARLVLTTWPTFAADFLLFLDDIDTDETKEIYTFPHLPQLEHGKIAEPQVRTQKEAQAHYDDYTILALVYSVQYLLRW